MFLFYFWWRIAMVRMRFVLFICFLLCFAVAGQSLADGPRIRFSTRQFDPYKGMNETPAATNETQEDNAGSTAAGTISVMGVAAQSAVRNSSESSSSAEQTETDTESEHERIYPADYGEAYYVLQFEGPVQKDWKQSVADLGVTFFDYIPEFAFLVKADAGLEHSIWNADHVRWLGAFTAEFKFSIDPDAEIAAGNTTSRYRIAAFPGEDATRIENELRGLGMEVESSRSSKWDIEFIVRATLGTMRKAVNLSGVKWIGIVHKPRILNNKAAEIIEATFVRENEFPLSLQGFYGEGQVVGVLDTGFDTNNPDTMLDDFKLVSDGDGPSSRIVTCKTYDSSTKSWVTPTEPDFDGHGTHVLGTVLGNGRLSGADPANKSYPDTCYAGMAPEAKAVLQADLNSSEADYLEFAYSNGAKIHSNSWSDLSFEYDSGSVNVDRATWDAKDFSVLFSASNYGVWSADRAAVDIGSLSGPGISKNSISVGACLNLHAYGSPMNPMWMAVFSSRGPTLDGRLKPDIVAPGEAVISLISTAATYTPEYAMVGSHYMYESGTSMACPAAAGATALLREYLQKEESIPTPSSALLKAALINGATDINPEQYYPGMWSSLAKTTPSYGQGFGRINLKGAVNTGGDYKVKFNDISESAPEDSSYSRNFQFDVVDSGQPFSATLCWTDYPGSENAQLPLVNDLDMRVKTPDGSYVYPDNACDKTGDEIITRSGPEDEDTMDTPVKDCGIVLTPSSYPRVLRRLHFWLYGLGSVEVALYKYNGEAGSGSIGALLYQTEVEKNAYYNNWDAHIIPLNITLESESVFVSLTCSGEKQSIYLNGDNTEGLGYVRSGGIWVAADKLPAISAEFISPDKVITVDRINNVERVSIDSPQAGTYTAEITAYQIPSGPQPYALVMSGAWGNVPTSGDDSVEVNSEQPDAPSVKVISTSRKTMSSSELNSEQGVSFDTMYSDVVQFSCEITSGDSDVVSFRYAVENLPEQAANTLTLEKLLGNGASRGFTYPAVKTYTDGNWWLETISGEFVDPTKVLSSSTKYYVVSVIEDGGFYDADSESGKITDPQVLIPASSSSGSTSGGGCTVGGQDDFYVLYLILLTGLVKFILKLREQYLKQKF